VASAGLSGSYIGLTYQTNNFPGPRRNAHTFRQHSDLQRNISFGFTEPYLFDRPISTGFTIFTSRYNFDQARQYSLAIGQQVQLNPNTVQELHAKQRRIHALRELSDTPSRFHPKWA